MEQQDKSEVFGENIKKLLQEGDIVDKAADRIVSEACNPIQESIKQPYEQYINPVDDSLYKRLGDIMSNFKCSDELQLVDMRSKKFDNIREEWEKVSNQIPAVTTSGLEGIQEHPVSANYMQVVENSQYYENLEQIQLNLKYILDRLHSVELKSGRYGDDGKTWYRVTSLETDIKDLIVGIGNTIEKYEMVVKIVCNKTR